jgi:hypothetical protein
LEDVVKLARPQQGIRQDDARLGRAARIAARGKGLLRCLEGSAAFGQPAQTIQGPAEAQLAGRRWLQRLGAAIEGDGFGRRR